MTSLRFPLRRPDGSFCVEVILKVESDNPGQATARIATWLHDWVARNQRSTWFGQDVAYSDEFAGEPSVVASRDGEVHFRVEAQSTATWWKDWLVALLRELEQGLPEVKAVVQIRNCDS